MAEQRTRILRASIQRQADVMPNRATRRAQDKKNGRR